MPDELSEDDLIAIRVAFMLSGAALLLVLLFMSGLGFIIWYIGVDTLLNAIDQWWSIVGPFWSL